MNIVTVVGQSDILPLFDENVLPHCGIICAPALTQLEAKEAVLVIGEGAVLPEKLSVLAAVVDNDSGFNASLLNGTAVVTCGLGSRNTVSITSKTAEYVTLSLNRSIQTLKGICEPMELPLPVREDVDDYAYMAAFAASVLLGNIG